MPAVRFSVQWPDGEKAIYYSPSTIIHQFFKPDSTIALERFLEQVDVALDAASERVFERFGYYCSSAADEQVRIREKAKELASNHVTGDIYYQLVS